MEFCSPTQADHAQDSHIPPAQREIWHWQYSPSDNQIKQDENGM